MAVAVEHAVREEAARECVTEDLIEERAEGDAEMRTRIFSSARNASSSEMLVSVTRRMRCSRILVSSALVK